MRPLGPVSWQRVSWPDGSTYEGLVKDDMCHLRGVSCFVDGDRYEGEFINNQMTGVGVYMWHDGTSFAGAWYQDKMHGCGIKVAEGSTTQAGQFVDDEYVGHTGVCDVAEARQAAKQATAAASLASGLQEQASIQGLKTRHHRPYYNSSIVSHATAFTSLKNNS